tara:strand:- start:1102 stop:2706 length:1605 start_codon:yes stop_codon:yes gene_type:complete
MGLESPTINATVSGTTTATVVNADDLEVDSGTLSIDADNNRVGINTTSPAKTLGVDGDLHFQPTAISTSHITTAGSLDIRADNNIKIGTDGADSIRLGRVNSTAVKVHLRSGTDNDVVISNSKVGIGTDSPSEALQVVGNVTLSGELDAATLDISGNADIDGTLEADAITVDGTALNEYIADTVGAMVSSNTESGITVAYQDADNTLDFTVGTLNQDTTGTAAIATAVTVADESSDTSCNVLFTTAATGNLEPKSGTNLTFNSSDGTLTATNFAGTLTTASQTNITGVGTVSTGTWQGTAIASAYLDADTAHLSGTQTFTGAKTFDADVIISGTTPQLTIGDAGAEDTMLLFDGNAQDFRIGIDDGSDMLEFGIGNAHGTTTTMAFDATQNIDVFRAINLDSAIPDNSICGITAVFTAGESLNRGDVVYFKASDSKMYKVNMTAGNADAIPAVAMAGADISADALGKFVLQGFVHDAGTFPTYTVAGRLYAPEAEGPPTQTAPSTDGDLVQVIGWAVTADKIYFNPSPDYIEVA